ncbi:GPW/gp25 family protein [Streptomyces sp. CSDS2]|uniref:GPW/gp25 family protein n=1 Tax=Streptomyces sp. CSDS2 TaxID=3055051 RepID=UPI0025AF5978|nr:GPW/gp25 family protein [Streptomyces sp. CSDS2]MDN3263990.1 GPW/gp25 family protein [Streptomyces sp. CSDS2]
MRPPSPHTRPRSDIAFPFHPDRRGRTAHARPAEHVHDLIEQLLFTSPGERVMRPDFGCGLLDLVFAPIGPELVSTLELSVQAALQRWLGDLIEVVSLDISGGDDTVRVQLSYLVRATGTVHEDLFEGRAA